MATFSSSLAHAFLAQDRFLTLGLLNFPLPPLHGSDAPLQLGIYGFTQLDRRHPSLLDFWRFTDYFDNFISVVPSRYYPLYATLIALLSEWPQA